MKTYKIKQSSPIVFIITYIVLVISSIGVFKDQLSEIRDQKLLLLILISVPFVVGYYLARFISTAILQIKMDELGIKIIWEKQFFLQKHADFEIEWTNISEFKIEPDRNFDQFKIVSKDGSEFKILHNIDHNGKDDYSTFLKDFELKVNGINSDDVPSNNIKKSPTFYEGAIGLTLAVIFGLSLIALTILLITSKHHVSNLAAIGSVYLGAFYYIAQVYNHRKNK